MNPVGGLRYRLVRDSTYRMLHDALNALGWFENDRGITFGPSPLEPWEPVPLNTLALTYVDMLGVEGELGSNYEHETWTMYLNAYVESDALGLHIAGDVRDILRGKMPSIGRTTPTVDVYDYTQATPPLVFTVEVEDVRLDHTRPPGREFHWFAVRFDLVDFYGDESDT